MNLNRGATEIVTTVHSGEQYADGMSVPEDDRGEALAWYFRLLVRQELEKGVTRTELCKRLGIGKGHLSQIDNVKLGIGVPKLVQFSAVFNLMPGQMLDNALSWWERHGRKEKARVLGERALKAEARASSKSGEHPSQSPLKIAK